MNHDQLRSEFLGMKREFRKIARSIGKVGMLLATPIEVLDGKPARRKPRLSAEVRAALKFQGKYMGTMRGLSRAQRSTIKRIRVEKGINAAIIAARKLADEKFQRRAKA